MTTTPTTDLAERVASPAPQRATTGTAGLVETMGPQFARALPAHIPAERFTRLALTALRAKNKNGRPMFEQCTPESFLGALMTCAQLGLEPNTPTGEAYLIPYGPVCTFVPGYQGLAKLAWQSGQIAEMYAEMVHERDEFHYELGLHRDLRHVPAPGDRGAVVGVYAVVRLQDGGTLFEYMTAAELDAHDTAHGQSRSAKAPADLRGWMRKKTVLRQVLKLVPKSTSMQQALAQDGAVRTDLSFAGVDVIESEAIEDVTDAEVVEETAAVES